MAVKDMEQYQFTSDQDRVKAVENGRLGGLASAAAKKERKTLADTIRRVLDEPAQTGSKKTRQDAMVEKALSNAFKNGSLKDLRIIAQLLGELTQKVELSGDSVIRVVKSEEEKQKLEDIGNLGI